MDNVQLTINNVKLDNFAFVDRLRKTEKTKSRKLK